MASMRLRRHGAEIARLRGIIEADGLDPDAPIPPGLATEIARLTRELEEARAELQRHRDDIAAASGELLVPLPEPGTDMARMMIANRLMREALERVVDGGCDRFTGTDCWRQGMDPDAKEYADRVCDPCYSRRALATPPEPPQ